MNPQMHLFDRRSFLKSAATITSGVAGLSMLPLEGWAVSDTVAGGNGYIHIVGPQEGYAPQIGTLVSMMNWMRATVLLGVKGLDREGLDFLFDEKSNTIGAMLMHMAATERFYQLHTLEGRKWGDWPEPDIRRWSAASQLGMAGRVLICGEELSYYLALLEEVRAATLSTLRNRDDKWLMSVDNGWFWGPTNNYCKWFHVVEHESNHNGQIRWIRGRLPVRG